MDFSPGLSPRSNVRGYTSSVCSAAAAATPAVTTASVDTSRSARGMPLVPSRASLVVIYLDDKEPVRPSVYCARATVLARTVSRVSASAASAFATMAPTTPHRSRRSQRYRQVVNYAMDSRDATHKSGTSTRVLIESGKVTSAVAADIAASCPLPAPKTSAPTGRGS